MSATEPKPCNRTEEAPHWYVLTVLRSSLQACEQLAAHADEFNARSAPGWNASHRRSSM